MKLIDKYLRCREEKSSILCISLDPIPDKFSFEAEQIKKFCLEIIEETHEYCCCYKINSQHTLFALTSSDFQEINEEIHSSGCFSILDHKLSDILDSNLVAISWIKKCGFDAFTYCPFPGNIKDTISEANKNGLGVFTLVLMSNPEAKKIQKFLGIEGKMLYEKIALEVKEARGDGIVVGITKEISEEDLERLRYILGKDTIFLCPGLGKQKGDPEKILELGGNLLINVGRSIIYSRNPKEKAKLYMKLLKKEWR
ncbi:MAG TPA: orotidine 5'-phosphate decarboxylase [Candidatus Altiarchaeales archaeon]|nr:orotidine 5'-phosphate decarboxylase [Candidatus Altiarchaeales archaeon]